MVGLDHGSDSPGRHDSPEIAAHNARIGLVLFFVYVTLYAGFVACAVAGVLDMRFGGTNLAVWYGFGLIGTAFVLALLYGVLCRSGGDEVERGTSVPRGPKQGSLDAEESEGAK